MPKVLYIAGWGRSGTTILDNLLNSHPTVFSGGELYFIWHRGLVQGRRCGCGERLPDCALWRRVLDAAFGADPPEPRRVVALQQRVARVRSTPQLTRAPLSAEAEEYCQLTGRLYQAIGEVTGADLIIDSSKVPSGAAALAQAPGVEPYLLHMTRDPRAVAHSWMRSTPQLDLNKPALMKKHKPAKSTASWLLWNGLTELVARRYPGRHQRLRYEDFVLRPRETIQALLAFTGVPATDGPFLDDRTALLRPNHTVSGNPGRFKVGEVTLRLDDAWVGQQRRGTQLLVTALALPMLPRYRYPLVPGGRGDAGAQGPRHPDVAGRPGG